MRKRIYDSPEYLAAFTLHQTLVARHADRVRKEGELRRSLESMYSRSVYGEPALQRALHALEGSDKLPPRDEAIKETQREHRDVIEQMEALAAGQPEALSRLHRLRERFTFERIREPDIQRAIHRQHMAAQELVASDREMHRLLDELFRDGFATGPHESFRFVLTLELDPQVPDAPAAIAGWAETLSGNLIRASKPAPVAEALT